VLAKTPRSAATIVTTSRGEPWTIDGFKTSWGRLLDVPEMARLREAGRVFHGLRKSAVVMLLEAGCTDAEVSAITGQSRDMVEHYARQVNQRRLSAAAVLKWEQDLRSARAEDGSISDMK
jgi:integrase